MNLLERVKVELKEQDRRVIASLAMYSGYATKAADLRDLLNDVVQELEKREAACP